MDDPGRAYYFEGHFLETREIKKILRSRKPKRRFRSNRVEKEMPVSYQRRLVYGALRRYLSSKIAHVKEELVLFELVKGKQFEQRSDVLHGSIAKVERISSLFEKGGFGALQKVVLFVTALAVALQLAILVPAFVIWFSTWPFVVQFFFL